MYLSTNSPVVDFDRLGAANMDQGASIATRPCIYLVNLLLEVVPFAHCLDSIQPDRKCGGDVQ